MFIDTHAHLDFPELKKDIETVFARAREAGIGKIINVGCNLEGSRSSVQLAEKYENIFASVGVHPHDAKTITLEVLIELEKLARHKKVCAIGEIGLDYFRMQNSKEIQIVAFEAQLILAQKLNLPVIIHSREADADILVILKNKMLNKNMKLRGVVHCFCSNAETAEKFLALDFLLSFTGIATYLKAENVREAIKITPLEKIMLETDSPFLAPQKYRGKINEPAFIIETAQKIAEIKGVSLAEIEKATTRNAEEFFGI